MAGGDLTHTVVPQTPVIENPAGDEVGDVGRAFNDIRTRIVDAIEGYDDTRARVSGLLRRAQGPSGRPEGGRYASAGRSIPNTRPLNGVEHSTNGSTGR